jgi:hypothetical protein
MGKPAAISNETEAEQAERLRRTAASERDALYINVILAIVLVSTLIYAILDSK